MRFGTGQNRFDVESALDDALAASPPIDRVDGVLDIAAQVLLDYAPDPSGTRIERMARWIVANVGGEPYALETVGAIARFSIGPAEARVRVLRCGDRVGIDREGGKLVAFVSIEQARAVAVALLRAIELAES